MAYWHNLCEQGKSVEVDVGTFRHLEKDISRDALQGQQLWQPCRPRKCGLLMRCQGAGAFGHCGRRQSSAALGHDGRGVVDSMPAPSATASAGKAAPPSAMASAATLLLPSATVGAGRAALPSAMATRAAFGVPRRAASGGGALGLDSRAQQMDRNDGSRIDQNRYVIHA